MVQCMGAKLGMRLFHGLPYSIDYIGIPFLQSQTLSDDLLQHAAFCIHIKGTGFHDSYLNQELGVGYAYRLDASWVWNCM